MAGFVIGVLSFVYVTFINTEYSTDMVALTLKRNPEYLLANGADSEGMYLGAIIGYSWFGVLISYPIKYIFNSVIISAFIYFATLIKRYRLTSRSS
ncbi:MAG: hypothetical protein WDA22_17250 [Bacteroidota bacterium]